MKRWRGKRKRAKNEIRERELIKIVDKNRHSKEGGGGRRRRSSRISSMRRRIQKINEREGWIGREEQERKNTKNKQKTREETGR